MFKKLVIISAIVMSPVAQARSLHPCTPTVQAAPIYIHCATDSARYEITVDTLMSRNLPECSGANHVEYQTAKVKVWDLSESYLGSLEIMNGSFSFTLSPAGDATFRSTAFSLDLNKCVTPLHGGITVGN